MGSLFATIPVDVLKVHMLPHLSPLSVERFRNTCKRYATRIKKVMDEWKHKTPKLRLYDAAHEGYYDMVKLFIRNGEVTDFYWPFFVAAKYERIDICELLAD